MYRYASKGAKRRGGELMIIDGFMMWVSMGNINAIVIYRIE